MNDTNEKRTLYDVLSPLTQYMIKKLKDEGTLDERRKDNKDRH